jgi:uncharacterized membrane protein AbrB (regulator of aidB expression)
MYMYIQASRVMVMVLHATFVAALLVEETGVSRGKNTDLPLTYHIDVVSSTPHHELH